MTHQDQGDAVVLCHPQQLRSGVADLGDRPGGGAHLAGPEGLYRVHDAHSGLDLFQGSHQHLGLGLNEEAQPAVLPSQTHTAQLDLRRRFLSGDEKSGHAPLLHIEESLEKERALTDAGLPTDQHHRAGHQPTPEDPVELGQAGTQPGLRPGVHVGEGEGRERRRRRSRAPRTGPRGRSLFR